MLLENLDIVELPLFFKKGVAPKDKIFINYRRDDAGFFAGRLSDSLTTYFGEERIFRDVTGIDYGDDFETSIKDKIDESGALIVLIGDKWTLLTDDQDQRRLDNPDDYVVAEIASALEAGVTVIPVLIANARMPQKDDLPEKLSMLVRHNAITITDERWDHDIRRLAKVIAIDLPGSVQQKRLDRLKFGAAFMLFVSGTLGTLVFCNALAGWTSNSDTGIRDHGFTPLVASSLIAAIILAGVWVLVGLRDMEEDKQKYGWIAVLIAGFGSAAAFVYYPLTNNQTPNWSLVVMFGGALIIKLSMFFLIAMAGFRAK